MKFSLEKLNDLKELVRNLSIGLTNLTFGDNFVSFEEEVSIPAAGTEVQIRNKLPFIPTRYIIVEQIGNGICAKSDTKWTKDYLYLQNHGVGDITVKVIFFR